MPQYTHANDVQQFAVHFEPSGWTGSELITESGYMESTQRHSHRSEEWS